MAKYLRKQLCNSAANTAETRLVPRPKNHMTSVKMTTADELLKISMSLAGIW
jgi:hypothetical protein